MANKRKLLGILVTVLVFGMVVVGCDTGDKDPNNGNGNGNGNDQNGNGTGGVFNLNLIPSQYDGKYIILINYYSSDDGPPDDFSDSNEVPSEDEEIFIIGAQSINSSNNTLKGVSISNRSANIPIWTTEDLESFTRYSGNDILNIDVIISDDETIDFEAFEGFGFSFIIGNDFGQVTFSNGNATKSWNDGETWHPDDFDDE